MMTTPPFSIDFWVMEKYENGRSILYELKAKEHFPYALLDKSKVNALANVDYETAKDALGLESYYDFNILIINGTGGTIISYGKNYDPREVISVCERDVLIRETRIVNGKITYTYEPAKMIVRVF